MSRVLKNKWAVLYSVILAIIVGVYFGDFAKQLEPLAKLYINLIKISIIPIVIITVTTSIASLVNQNNSSEKTKKIFFSLVFVLFACSASAILIGGLSQPGMGLSKNPDIAKLIASSHTEQIILAPKDPIILEKGDGLMKFIENAIPSNIFEALSTSKFLQIVFFGVIFGLALGYSYQHDRVDRWTLLKSYLPAFEWIMDQVILLLPIGIFLLISTQVSEMQLSTFLMLFKVTCAIIGSMMLVVLASFYAIAYFSKQSFLKVVRALSQVCLVAISTRSTFACVPRAIEAMTTELKFDRTMASLVISFGGATCKFGTVCFYCVASVFVANVLDFPLSWHHYFIIIFASVLTAISSAGSVGIIGIQMISLVLEPIGLPLGAVVILLIAINPITDIFDTLANVLGNCAVAAGCSPLDLKGSKIEAG